MNKNSGSVAQTLIFSLSLFNFLLRVCTQAGCARTAELITIPFQDNAEEDEEQKRESLKRPSKSTEEQDKPKEKLIPAPLRPPSLNRHSGDHSDLPQQQQQSTPAVLEVSSDERTQHNDTKPPVDQAAVTISIGDNKKKEDTGSEPHLVAYKKVASPAPGMLFNERIFLEPSSID